MKEDRSLLLWLAAPMLAGLLVLGGLLWLGIGQWRDAARRQASASRGPVAPAKLQTGEADETTPSTVGMILTEEQIAAMLDAMLKRRVQSVGAIADEAILRFKTKEAYEAFLQEAAGKGLKVLSKLDDFRAVRVGYENIEALRRELMANADALDEVGANYLVKIPGVPEKEERADGGTQPFGDDLFGALGALGNRSTWGQGVTVAVVDAGLTNHPTFREGQVTHLDLVGDGQAFNGHGDAMGSLIAGTQPGAEGLAPAARLLDVRIFDANGDGDSFILAQGIQFAVDKGAQIINISGASYGDSSVVRDAIDYATSRGATIIAAVGNEQAGIKAYPAAYENVISVSSVDSQNKLAYFSNSGDPTLAAPGVGVPSAYSEDGHAAYVYGDGTSQSAALASGAAAVLLSKGENPSKSLINYTRTGNATAHEVGAGVLYLGPK
jgi:thermitase